MQMKSIMTGMIMMRIMNKLIFSVLLMALVFPSISFAHETRMFEINGVEYEMVVGSLNEPVIVDDKTGVTVEIVRDGAFLVGAQDSLQVEMISGDKKKVVNLSPVYGYEGQYKSNFIATVPTTLTYRVFGTLEDVPVDISFTCNPAGHPQSEEDTSRTEISDKVFQTLKRGTFGCPQPKEEFGFPEPAPSSFEMDKSVNEIQTAVPSEQSQSNTASSISVIALVLSLLACCALFFVYTKKK
jgi:hypothetical protein